MTLAIFSDGGLSHAGLKANGRPLRLDVSGGHLRHRQDEAGIELCVRILLTQNEVPEAAAGQMVTAPVTCT